VLNEADRFTVSPQALDHREHRLQAPAVDTGRRLVDEEHVCAGRQHARDREQLPIAETKPAPKDQPIEVLSGYWRLAYDCNLNGFAYRLHEYVWTWRLSLRYSDGGCQVIGGTSGSPVLDSTRVMIGINNTINEDGQRCTFDNPCEEDRHGNITVHLHRGYGQETWVFYTCLTNNAIDLAKSGCMLPKP